MVYFSNQTGWGTIMKTEFDITLQQKDLYRFSMQHAYRGSQGIISLMLAAVCLFVAVKTSGSAEITDTLLYAAFGILFLFYLPVHLYLRAKKQMLSSEALRNTLHYVIDAEGIHASQKEETADLSWEMVYKIRSASKHVLIYSSRVNAYIIPRRQLTGEDYDCMRQLALDHLPKYRVSMK